MLAEMWDSGAWQTSFRTIMLLDWLVSIIGMEYADDHPSLRVVAEEQPEPSPDPGSPPVAMGRPQAVVLAVLVTHRAAQRSFQHQLAQRPEQLDIRIGFETRRIALPLHRQSQ